ncbi:MAG: RNA-binding S4 domain-containing protein [Rhodobacteraceae bacterium]|nr:RNA-binding S4 domain-containing protein [Paracoccaceae bacterium]
MNTARPTIRIDKWLWFARFFKSRSLSAKLVAGGHMRVNSERVSKGSFGIGAGDVLTFPQGDHVRVIEVVAIGERRGPAPEAQALYCDLSPPQKKDKPYHPPNPEAERSGRPNRQERAAMDRFKDNSAV